MVLITGELAPFLLQVRLFVTVVVYDGGIINGT